jgi:hypothetical protein
MKKSDRKRSDVHGETESGSEPTVENPVRGV